MNNAVGTEKADRAKLTKFAPHISTEPNNLPTDVKIKTNFAEISFGASVTVQKIR